jgi:hypothetical protein
MAFFFSSSSVVVEVMGGKKFGMNDTLVHVGGVYSICFL